MTSSPQSSPAEFRAEFLSRLSDTDAEMANLIATARDQDATQKDATLALLRETANETASGARALDLVTVSEAAVAVEKLSAMMLDAQLPADDAAFDELDAARRGFTDAVAGVTGPADGPAVEAPLEAEKRRIVIAPFGGRADLSEAETLLRSFGFEVVDAERCSADGRAPDAVVAEVNAKQNLAPEAAALLTRFGDDIGPLIGVSTDESIHARLAAVRVGCGAFLPLPLDPARLVDELDRLTTSGDEPPARIMVVDDDVVTASYADAILKKAGMITEVMTDPLQLMARAETFAPELILMDLYMPDCSGIELAAVLRQQEAYAGIPIVFLSGERDMETQLGAMGRGGDDFLTKPIKPQHLISAVRTRVTRFRALRDRMVRDSLTGLYNHTTTKQFLANEVARAERRGTALSFAIVDIDHFKNVNDTYGHAVGDMVIKSLARLLRQRLRSIDIIGRMGGEEFAVILAEADGGNAQRVMDEIREAFAGIGHATAAADLHSTFSCGVASVADYPEPQALTEAADAALYEAKHGGRNQVVLAGSGAS